MINIIEPKIQISKQRQIFTNKNLKNLIIPLIIEQLLVLLVGIADTLMVSYAGEAAVSGVSLVNQLNNVFLYIFNALASGGAVVASQYIGNKDQKNGNLAASQLVMITTVISVFLILFAILLREQLLTLLFGDVESDVMSACLTYLIISAFSFPALAIYNSCAGLFRSMSKANIVVYVSFLMKIINVAGNAIGIFVLHAGVAGVAYPSLISRTVAAIVLLILISSKKNVLYVPTFRRNEQIKIDKNVTDYIDIGKNKKEKHDYKLKIIYDKNKSENIYDIIEKIQVKVHTEQKKI